MAQISLRVDDELKRGAEKTLNDIGLSKENMKELERRVHAVRSGESTLKEHELIEED